MSTSIYSVPLPTAIQFGNPGDTSGYRVVSGEVIAERKGMCGRVYLVREGKTYGAATFDSKKGRYYCTNAIPLGMVFRGHEFTAADLARHFSFEESLFV